MSIVPPDMVMRLSLISFPVAPSKETIESAKAPVGPITSPVPRTLPHLSPVPAVESAMRTVPLAPTPRRASTVEKVYKSPFVVRGEAPPPAAAHVPSARRKLVVPPPDSGTRPLSSDVNTGRIAFTCATVRSEAFAVPPVLLPLIVRVAICAAFALVTALLAIVVANEPVPEPVTSDVSVIV